MNRSTDMQLCICRFNPNLCLRLCIQQMQPFFLKRKLSWKMQMCHMHKNGILIGKCIFGNHILSRGNWEIDVYIQFIHKGIDLFICFIYICIFRR